MEKAIEQYWSKRLAAVKQSLENNGFEAHLADTSEDAMKIVLEKIMPDLKPNRISWGGSMTFTATGLYEALKADGRWAAVDTYDKKIPREEVLERRRQALLVDLFFTGTNAVTEAGHLVNLDMIGNRVAALTFGPKNVVVLAGRNKITTDLEEAMLRIKNYAAPVNTMRLGKKTPCNATGFCEDCSSPDRICNTWTITEKSFPKGRVKVVLINQDLGF